MVSVFLYCALVLSGTALLSSFSSSPAILDAHYNTHTQQKKGALSEGHPDLMQCTITENIPPAWTQTHWPDRQRGLRDDRRGSKRFFFFCSPPSPSHMIPHQSAYRDDLAPQVGHERRGACFRAWFTVGQMTGIVEEGNCLHVKSLNIIWLLTEPRIWPSSMKEPRIFLLSDMFPITATDNDIWTIDTFPKGTYRSDGLDL